MISTHTKQDSPIITELTDNDQYKYSMQQTFLHNYPAATAEYRFKCRNKDVKLGQYADEINAEVDNLCTLQYTQKELDYLGTKRWLTPDYIEFLRLFKLNRNYVSIENFHGDLIVSAGGSKVPLVHAMPFELYVLPIIQEVYTRRAFPDMDYTVGECRLNEKINAVKKYNNENIERANRLNKPVVPMFSFADFGGRRRFNKSWHKHVVNRLHNELPNNFVGTSNVALAIELGITSFGTMAHEYLQAFQALGPKLADFQKVALNTWANEFRGDLGIALTDVVGVDAFCRDLDLFLAKLFDGYRHDSGKPVLWAWKIMNRLNELKINTMTKTAVWSDSLSIDLALSLHTLMVNNIVPFFGIGTHLTNDIGIVPLNNVMKIVWCNGSPVAKISDSAGKGMCEDAGFETYLKDVFNIEG